MDHFLPDWLKFSSAGLRYLESNGVSESDFGGPPRVTSLGGDRLGISLQYTTTASSTTDSAMERRRIMAAHMGLQGRYGRLYSENPARTLQGSFASSELLTNPSWASGTTGWDSSGSEAVVTVTDRRLRSTRADAITARSIRNTTSFAVTQYAPYALRAMAIAGRGSLHYGLRLGSTNGGNDLYSLSSTTAGLLTGVAVPISTPAYFSLLDGVTDRMAGDYQSFDYVSVSRCAVADCAPNLLIYSSDLTQADWTMSNVSIPTPSPVNSVTLPDGSTGIINHLRDITSSPLSSQHRINQAYTASSSAADYCLAGAFKAVNRNFIALRMYEGTGGTLATANFNLGTGAVGTTAVGSNWANVRAFIAPLGNSWYYCAVVANKTNSATALEARIYICDADNSFTFTGAGTNAVNYWNPTFAQSSLPVRLSSTTTSAVSDGTDQTGSGIYLKGLPASSTGLLLPGDEIEVITSYGSEYKWVTNELQSDAAGLGYLSISPPLRGPLENDAAIIIAQPLGCWMAGESLGFDHTPGTFTNASIELQEAV